MTLSLVVSPLWNALDTSSTKALVSDVTILVSYVLPPVLCYFAMALLAITPRTRAIRLALCPVVLFLALRAAVPVNLSLKSTERRLHHNSAIWVLIFMIRALDWGLARNPLVRQLRPANSTPSTLMDALDLMSNCRGYGWNWSGGVHIPRESHPSSRTGFVLRAILSAATYELLFIILQAAIMSFAPVGLRMLSSGPAVDASLPFLPRMFRLCFPMELGTMSAESIFDESLPIHLRFLRSSIVTILALMWVYVSLQALYNVCIVPAVLVLGQDAAQWPPLFDAPWRATSLTDFWGRRWHQLLRRIFLFLGGYPLSYILGRPGIVIGSFLASAMCHHVGFITLNSKSEFWRIAVGFGMMAPGIILERVFTSVTGKRVQGIVGWTWTLGWSLLWGNVIVDAHMRAGVFGSPALMNLVPPVRMAVIQWATKFDDLLHTMS